MDYNIYIHSNVSSSTRSQTEPWKEDTESPTSSWSAERVASTIANPEALIGQGVTLAKKAIPAIAAAVIVGKACVAAWNTANQFIAASTGDYRHTIAHQNFQAIKSWIFQPLSTAISYYQTVQHEQIQDQKQAMHRLLLGDAQINGMGRGV